MKDGTIALAWVQETAEESSIVAMSGKPLLSWIPVVKVGSHIIELNPRPFKGFKKFEREAILVEIKQIVAQDLFGETPQIFSESGKKFAENPVWKLLPVWEIDVDGKWSEKILDSVDGQ